MNKPKQIWMYGGGVQSCAIAALIVQGKLPMPDVAVMADTGRERQSTWDFLKNKIQPALGLEIQIVDKAKFRAPDLWQGESLLLPVYSDINGAASKLPTYCSGYWKKDTLNRYLSEVLKIPPRDRVTWFGFSLDEARRILRMKNAKANSRAKFRFPLVDDVALRRGGCGALVEKMGWGEPPRSACWMCPNQRHDEWQDLKENSPDEFLKAVELERTVRKKDKNAFFHRSLKPLDSVDFSREPDLFQRPCDSGLCFI